MKKPLSPFSLFYFSQPIVTGQRLLSMELTQKQHQPKKKVIIDIQGRKTAVAFYEVLKVMLIVKMCH